MALCPGSTLEHFIGSLINVGPGQLRLCCLKKPRKSYSFGKVICIPSTWRELKAVDQVLRSFAEKLAGRRVKWFTDYQNVVRIVQSGSRRQHLQDGAMSIFEVCLANNIRLDIAWIPRSLNDRADFISRIVDYDDWQLCSRIFHQLDNMWGPHTIDRFASCYNSQLAHYDSRFWDPHCGFPHRL